MNIKNMIHDKNKRKNPGNWDKNIMTACLTKRSHNYSLDECHIVESNDEIPRANLAHPNFATFSHS